MKKATARDVAREAGVSVATVSYVFNNRTEMKISEATRKKVLQIANLLQYTPSYAAKSLATGKSNIIGIQTGTPAPDAILDINNIELIKILAHMFAQKGYDLMLLPELKKDGFVPKQNLDAIIAFDLSGEDFSFLSGNYLIPVVNVDMVIELYLFFEIYYDFNKIADRLNALSTDYKLIMRKPQNEKLRDYICSCFGDDKVRFIEKITDIAGIIKTEKSAIVCFGEHLAAYAASYFPRNDIIILSQTGKNNFLSDKFRYVDLDANKKADRIVESVFNAINRVPDIEHRITV